MATLKNYMTRFRTKFRTIKAKFSGNPKSCKLKYQIRGSRGRFLDLLPGIFKY